MLPNHCPHLPHLMLPNHYLVSFSPFSVFIYLTYDHLFIFEYLTLFLSLTTVLNNILLKRLGLYLVNTVHNLINHSKHISLLTLDKHMFTSNISVLIMRIKSSVMGPWWESVLWSYSGALMGVSPLVLFRGPDGSQSSDLVQGPWWESVLWSCSGALHTF